MKDKNGFYLVLTAIILELVFVGFLVWLCEMGRRHPELTKQKCEYSNFQGYCFINTMKPQIPVSQDAAGTYRINTFNGEPDYPYLTVVACYNPFDNTYTELAPAGENDCVVTDIREAQGVLKDKIYWIAKITEKKYVVAVCMSVCHPEWIVIYLHDKKNYAGKEVYENLWSKM
jgi:hypothetical protein